MLKVYYYDSHDLSDDPTHRDSLGMGSLGMVRFHKALKSFGDIFAAYQSSATERAAFYTRYPPLQVRSE